MIAKIKLDRHDFVKYIQQSIDGKRNELTKSTSVEFIIIDDKWCVTIAELIFGMQTITSRWLCLRYEKEHGV